MTTYLTMSLTTRRSVRHRIAGVSLIELMVSLVIGSLLILGAVSVYMQSRNTYRTNDSAARLQEITRYALDTIEPDVRMAGFWGLTSRPDAIANGAESIAAQEAVDAAVAAPNCGNNWTVDVARYLDGRDNGDYDLACPGTDPVNWADILIVRRASSTTESLTDNRMQIQTNRVSGMIFNDGVRPADFLTPPASETHDLLVHAYYVSEVLPSPGGVRQFALRRQTLTMTGGVPDIVDQVVIPGIEDLQVQFGVDTTGDANADVYFDSDNVPAAGLIVSARIWVLAIAEDREIGFVNGTPFAYANRPAVTYNDDRRRLLVSKTIQIRNVTL